MPTRPTIARSGRTRRDVADHYELYLRDVGIPPLGKTALGVQLFREDRDGETWFTTISYCSELDAMRQFTKGDAPRRCLGVAGQHQYLWVAVLGHAVRAIRPVRTVNLALIPVLLFALAALNGEERPTWRHALAIAMGCAGLVGLFWTRLGQGGGSAFGLAAIVTSTACYCIASVVARPLVGPVKTLALTLVQAALGGAALLVLSLMSETVSATTVGNDDGRGASSRRN